jgi:cysteine desulfurase
MIYLDNNATTTMPKCVMKAMLSWCNMGNPSAGYATARESRAMMEKFRKRIGELCAIDTCCPEDRDVQNVDTSKCDPAKYKVIFTSGASEANSTIINGAVAAYADARNLIPHLVISAIEHKGLISTARSIEERGQCTITYVQPTLSGHILARDVAAAIKPTTCLVCVMHANNETGAINDVAAIGAAAHSRGVPFHCDVVQTFGKFPIRPLSAGIDSFCVSFHKFHGPPGIGLWCVKQKFLLGWKIPPLIFGSQNEGYRGGTENLPGIGASYEAIRYNFHSREEKNGRIAALKNLLTTELGKIFPMQTYTEYCTDGPHAGLELVVFSVGDNQKYLFNTILLSVVKLRGEFICNVKIKNSLEAQGIVVSVGSACNTASAKASHVLYAMGADKYIRKGTLRISLGDDNTEEEIHTFVKAFNKAVRDQL